VLIDLKIVVDLVYGYGKVLSMATQTYKKLNGKDKLRKGDEWENLGINDWEPIATCHIGDLVEHRNSDTFGYRRPIKAKRVKTEKPLNVGKVCRVVEGDEIVQKGDQWETYREKDWRKCHSQIGLKASTYRTGEVVRRKVEEPVKNPSRPTYIILTREDKIEAGDEYFDKYSETWARSEYVGSNPPIPAPYRRLVK
jgi:hypothetical protein